MNIGFLGLGKMGYNMVLQLIEKKHKVVVYNRSPDKTRKIAKQGAIPSYSIDELLKKLPDKKIVWIMVPNGKPVDVMIQQLTSKLKKGDILIDGGNSEYVQTIKRADALKKKGIHFLDAGCSGGPSGARNGLSIMIGGDKKVFNKLRPLFKSLSVKNGFEYLGGSGAGHFVKMVHNGIEYALMQAYGEGFDLIKNGPYKKLDLKKVASVWRHGSVIESKLLDLLEIALKKDPELNKMPDHVDDSGEGRWTVDTAVKHAVPVNTIASALFARFRSRQRKSFAGQVSNALRHEFGGHEIKK